jgi:hypothetical protein
VTAERRGALAHRLGEGRGAAEDRVEADDGTHSGRRAKRDLLGDECTHRMTDHGYRSEAEMVEQGDRLIGKVR